METGNFSGLQNGNWKFYSFHFVKRKCLRHINRKISGFHLYRNYPGIPVYATNFRIIPFPKWKFFSGKMETLGTSITVEYPSKMVETYCKYSFITTFDCSGFYL